MRKTSQSLVEKDGKLLVQTVITEELSETGCIYIALRKDFGPQDLAHCIYKLHGFRAVPRGETRYIWTGLWNSCSVTGPFTGNKKAGPFNSIEDAIRWATTDTENHGGKYRVVKCHFSDLVTELALNKLYETAEIVRKK